MLWDALGTLEHTGTLAEEPGAPEVTLRSLRGPAGGSSAVAQLQPPQHRLEATRPPKATTWRNCPVTGTWVKRHGPSAAVAATGSPEGTAEAPASASRWTGRRAVPGEREQQLETRRRGDRGGVEGSPPRKPLAPAPGGSRPAGGLQPPQHLLDRLKATQDFLHQRTAAPDGHQHKLLGDVKGCRGHTLVESTVLRALGQGNP